MSIVLTTLSVCVSLGILVLGAFLLLQGRSNTWSRAERASNNLVLALERDIARNVRLIDLSLQGVIEALAEKGIAEASPQVRHRALFARAAGAEELGSVLLLDPYGTVVEDSTAVSPHRLNLADRDYFRVHMDHSDAGLYVSRAYRSRLRADDLSVAISRRLPDKNGEFGGVVIGALRLNYLQRLFQELDIGAEGSISLVRTDGRLIARHPLAEADFDRDLSDRAVFQRFMQAESGSFVGKSLMDGTKRFYTFRRIRGLPLVLAVNIAVQDVLDPWTHRALMIGSLLALLCAAVVTMSVLFRREMVRRASAERALTESADELARLAATDALTGLTNRRGLESEMQAEWQRAIRGKTSLALLMIDADFFKSYNDQYGHPAGDRVLRTLATCIEQSVRRTADCAARYGGEEFAALLPETTLVAALTVAENIRAAVIELEIPHAGSPRGAITVSIGVACVWPHAGGVSADLVHAADTALYTAKRDGRDRVRAAEPDTIEGDERIAAACPAELAETVMG